MKDFINAFKNTSYYQDLFNSYNIVMIYVGGSRCTSVIDERSDYDLVVITLDGKSIDSSAQEFLKYKGRKVHWYYRPLSAFYNAGEQDTGTIIGTMFFRNILPERIIYENPQYSKLISQIDKLKNDTSLMGIHLLYRAKLSLIKDILAEDYISEKNYTKHLYHLCLATYYITGEDINIELLSKLKRIKYIPVEENYKKLAVERLRLYNEYINSHKIDVEKTLKSLYEELMSCA